MVKSMDPEQLGVARMHVPESRVTSVLVREPIIAGLHAKSWGQVDFIRLHLR